VPCSFVLVILTSLSAAAETERLEDRVFFALSGGASQVRTESFIDVSGAEHLSLVAPLNWRAAFTVGWWPTDWLGVQFDAAMMGLGVGADERGAWSTSGLGVQLSPSLRLALPLRWLAPYVGIGAAAFAPFFSEQRGDVRWTGAGGIQFGPRFYAGTNVYCSRDVRFFLDLELFFLATSAPLRAEALVPSSHQYRGVVVPSLSLGVAWTPEAYRQSSSKPTWVLLALLPAVAMGVVSAVMIAEAKP
jgi:hypothetical protein